MGANSDVHPCAARTFGLGGPAVSRAETSLVRSVGIAMVLFTGRVVKRVVRHISASAGSTTAILSLLFLLCGMGGQGVADSPASPSQSFHAEDRPATIHEPVAPTLFALAHRTGPLASVAKGPFLGEADLGESTGDSFLAPPSARLPFHAQKRAARIGRALGFERTCAVLCVFLC